MPNNKNDTVTVGKIYANWCGHCTAMAPEWEKMKKIIQQKAGEQKIEFKEIESEQEGGEVGEINSKISPTPKLESKGYPTLFAIRGGNLSYYEGERKAETMADWFLNDKKSGGKKKSKKTARKNKKTRQTRKSKGLFRFLW